MFTLCGLVAGCFASFITQKAPEVLRQSLADVELRLPEITCC